MILGRIVLNTSGPYDFPAGQPAAYQAAAKRWEIRLSEATLASWRDIARRQGAGLADVVRAAMEIAAELPPGTVRARLDRAEADRAAGADAAMAELARSFHARANETGAADPAAAIEAP